MMDTGKCLSVLVHCLSTLARPPAASDTLSRAAQGDELAAHMRAGLGSDVQQYLTAARGIVSQSWPAEADEISLGDSDGDNVHWQYACRMAEVLLAAHIHADQATPAEKRALRQGDVLSMQLAVQVVALWGIAPYLDEGVAWPAVMRVDADTRNKVPVFRAAQPPPNLRLSLAPCAKAARLQHMVRLLWACVHPATPISTAMRSHALGEITMALCQIVYGPERHKAVAPEGRKAAADLLHQACMSLSPDDTLEAFSVPLARRECPRWLREACKRYLSLCVSRPGGINALLVQMVAAVHTEDAVDSVAAKAAEVVAVCPPWIKAPEAYYAPICAQLHTLLHLRVAARDEVVRKVMRGTLTIIYRLLDTTPQHTRRFLLANGMCKALRCPSDGDELALQQCVEDIHRVFVAGKGGAAHMQVLEPYIAALFQLHCFVRTTVSGLRTSTREVLGAYLRALDSRDAARLLLSFVLPAPTYSHKDSPQYEFVLGEGGGVVMQAVRGATEDKEVAAEAVADLLGELKQTAVPGDYFVALVDELVRVAEEASPQLAVPLHARQNYLEVGGEQTGTLGDRYLRVLQSTVKLAEAMGVTILRRAGHVVRFAQLLAGNGDEDGETTAMALGLVTAVLSGGVDIAPEDEPQVAAVHTWLEPYTHHPDPQVREMANDLRATIRTRDPSWANVPPVSGAGNHCGPVVDEQTVPAAENHCDPVEDGQATLATSLADLRDSMLPIRAHGLITLRRLVRLQDPATAGHVDKIYDIFDSNLRQADSYLYLNAIHGLVDLVCVQPVGTLGRVLAGFSDARWAEEDRLKYGEVVSKVAEQCPADVMLPHAADTTHALLYILSTPEESGFIHASALAALAMMCRMHGPAMHNHIKDIVLAVNDAMLAYMDETARPMVVEATAGIGAPPNSDQSPQPPAQATTERDMQPLNEKNEVRRGAMHVLALLFKGLGPDSLRIMAPYLRSTLQQLRRVASSDPDDITRTHAQVALEELDAIVFAVFGLQRVEAKDPARNSIE